MSIHCKSAGLYSLHGERHGTRRKPANVQGRTVEVEPKLVVEPPKPPRPAATFAMDPPAWLATCAATSAELVRGIHVAQIRSHTAKVQMANVCSSPMGCELWVRLYDEEDNPLTSYSPMDAAGGANVSWPYGLSPTSLTAHVAAAADATHCTVWKPMAATPTWRSRVEQFGASNRGSNHDEDGSLAPDDDIFRRLRPTISNVSIAASAASVCRGALPSEVAVHFLFLQSDAEVAGLAEAQSDGVRATCHRWTFPPTSRTLLACLALENTLLCSGRYDLATHRIAAAEAAAPARGALECEACFGAEVNDHRQLILRLVAPAPPNSSFAAAGTREIGDGVGDGMGGRPFCESYELYARGAAEVFGGRHAVGGDGALSTSAGAPTALALLGYAQDAPLRLQLPMATATALTALPGESALIRAYAACSMGPDRDGGGRVEGGGGGARVWLLSTTFNITALARTRAHEVGARRPRDSGDGAGSGGSGDIGERPTSALLASGDTAVDDEADGRTNTSALSAPWPPPMCIDCERSGSTQSVRARRAAATARHQKKVLALLVIGLALYATLRASDREIASAVLHLPSAVRAAAQLAVRWVRALRWAAARVQARVLNVRPPGRQPLSGADAAAAAARNEQTQTERPAIELAALA